MRADTKIFGCMADPIDHVKAPSIFSKYFKNHNINAVMIPINVKSQNLESFFNGIIKIKNFYGLTVTIPHKTKVLNFCNNLQDEAIETNAVNWIKIEGDKLIGANFDGIGFVEGLKKDKLILREKSFCVFGIGGAGLAICNSLLKENISKLKIINRNIKKSESLKEELTKRYIKSNIVLDDFYNNDISDYDYVINATSLGLKDNKERAFDVKKTKKDAIIVDIIMDPEETILIKEAIKNGRRFHVGKNMLESQIKLAGNFFNLW